MTKLGETIGHAELVGGGPTALHKHAGTLVLLNADEVEGTGGATEQTKTYALAANTYARILVEFNWEISGGTNALFEWTLAVEIPQSTVIHDSNLRNATGASSIFKYAGEYKGSAIQTGAATLRVRMTPVTAGGATARILAMRVYGVL